MKKILFGLLLIISSFSILADDDIDCVVVDDIEVYSYVDENGNLSKTMISHPISICSTQV
jgi:hypothetical protein